MPPVQEPQQVVGMKQKLQKLLLRRLTAVTSNGDQLAAVRSNPSRLGNLQQATLAGGSVPLARALALSHARSADPFVLVHATVPRARDRAPSVSSRPGPVSSRGLRYYGACLAIMHM